MKLPKKCLQAFVLILIFQVILLLAFVFLRLIDFDEGSYLSSAYLVKCGKLPYLDFFFPQMPYLPYVYALVSSYGLSSLYYGRLISFATGIFLSVLIFWFAYKFFKDEKLSLFLFFLHGFNGLVLSWHGVVKTLVFSDLFGFISFIFLIFYLSSGRKSKLFWAGFFVGIAFNFRLTFFLILLIEGVMVFVLLPYESLKKRIVDVFLLISGAILASGFAIYLFLKNPEVFVFGNIGFHQAWGLEVIKMTLLGKLYTFSKFIFSPQNLFILILAVISMIWLAKKLIKGGKPTSIEDKIVIFSLSISLAMITTGFLMSPTEFQYYEQALPYLLFSSAPVLSKLISKWKDKKLMWRGFAVFYLLSAVPFIVVFIFAIRPKDVPFRIDKTREVVEVVKQNSSPGEKILSGWPGYVIFAQRESVPGMETFGWAIIHLLSQEQIENFRLLDRQKISEMISAQKVNMIIADKWFLCDFEDLIEANYHLVEAFEFAKVYVKEKPKNQD